jgi:hypothetical protein
MKTALVDAARDWLEAKSVRLKLALLQNEARLRLVQSELSKTQDVLRQQSRKLDFPEYSDPENIS